MSPYEQDILAALSGREMGQLPISIGTSLALEGAFGILEDHPNPAPVIHKVDVLYLNLRTLIRNIAGAVDADVNAQLTAEDLSAALANELQIIETAVKQYTGGRVEIVPYMCEYKSLKRRFPHAMMKETKTEKQVFAFTREMNALADFEEKMGWIYSKKFDIEFDKDDRVALILTSYAIDLLQRYKFTSLTLLESHTGAAKPPAMWYTKLNNGKELTSIPFDRMTIQMFGDGSNLFSPFPIKIRKHMIMVAEKNKWTPMSTKALILESIKKERDPVLEALILNLYGGNK
jgi:hypothetical protein